MIPLFSKPACLALYRYCKAELYVDHSQDKTVKGVSLNSNWLVFAVFQSVMEVFLH